MADKIRKREDWSCPHGGRWIGFDGQFMQVVAPMVETKQGLIVRTCKCEPPKAELKIEIPDDGIRVTRLGAKTR